MRGPTIVAFDFPAPRRDIPLRCRLREAGETPGTAPATVSGTNAASLATVTSDGKAPLVGRRKSGNLAPQQFRSPPGVRARSAAAFFHARGAHALPGDFVPPSARLYSSARRPPALRARADHEATATDAWICMALGCVLPMARPPQRCGRRTRRRRALGHGDRACTAASATPTRRRPPPSPPQSTRPTDASTVDTVADVLSDAAGVTVRRLGGPATWSILSIRGSSANEVQMYLDGIPLSRARNETVNLSNLPLDSLERIEVYRGTTPAPSPWRASAAWSISSPKPPR